MVEEAVESETKYNDSAGLDLSQDLDQHWIWVGQRNGGCDLRPLCGKATTFTNVLEQHRLPAPRTKVLTSPSSVNVKAWEEEPFSPSSPLFIPPHLPGHCWALMKRAM